MVKFMTATIAEEGTGGMPLATLNLVSTRPRAGKTSLAGALARRQAARGKKVAYYKPLCVDPVADPDLAFVAEMLESLGSPQEAVPRPFPQPIDPHQLPTRLSEARSGQVAEAVMAMEAAFDTVLVEWDAPVVPEGRSTVLLHSHAAGQDLQSATDLVTGEWGRLGGETGGVIINNVLLHRGTHVGDGLAAPLKKRGIPMLGAIPEDREMLAFTLRQVAEFLEGEWVREPADPDAWVDRFLIGGNIMDSGPNYFGRYRNQAVITRAARPDIQMASLMCDTKFLVLTGGDEPTEYIRVEAQKRNAALLLVPGGTQETAESLGDLQAHASPYILHKLERFTSLADQYLEGGLDGVLV
jgi:BioD-like phosphotransacetylase family protein